MMINDDSWKWRGMRPVQLLVVQAPTPATDDAIINVTPVKPTADITKKASVIAELLQDLDDTLDIPEKDCRCCISPPCSDCVDHSWSRELRERIKDMIKELTP